MIKTEFVKKEDGTVSLSVKGHAGMAARGQDIICSAASILVLTLAQTLDYIYPEGWLTEAPLTEICEGSAFISARPKEDFTCEIMHTFFIAEVGFSLLAKNYPQHVQLKMFGEARAVSD